MAIDGTQPGSGLDAVGALSEPSRRALYEYVVAQGGWVSREQAADAIGMERGTAAHHLDRLATDGLLMVDYRRLTGRQGPGAGRPAKVYRRSDREFTVSLPPRDYELAGRLLAAAAERSRFAGTPIVEALEQEARGAGTAMAADMRARAGGASRRTGERRRAVLAVLDDHGFEPEEGDDGTIVLRNCPFHHLATQFTELICRMNLQLLEAAVADAGRTGLVARLEPEDGQCCVKLRPAR